MLSLRRDKSETHPRPCVASCRRVQHNQYESLCRVLKIRSSKMWRSWINCLTTKISASDIVSAVTVLHFTFMVVHNEWGRKPYGSRHPQKTFPRISDAASSLPSAEAVGRR